MRGRPSLHSNPWQRRAYERAVWRSQQPIVRPAPEPVVEAVEDDEDEGLTP